MKKYLRANEAFFITKKQRAPIMKRSRLRNKFFKKKKKNQASRDNYKTLRNYCKKHIF